MKAITYIAPLLAIACTACASGNAAKQPIKIVSDTHCRIDSEIGWSKSDTPETINAIRKHNSRFRRACR